MNIRTRWVIAGLVVASAVVSLAAAPRKTAAPPRQNVQVLKGLTPEDMMSVMQAWTAQTGTTCTTCHVAGDYSNEDKEQKDKARKMYAMVQLLNQQPVFTDGSRKADCYLCHRGNLKVPTTPIG